MKSKKISENVTPLLWTENIEITEEKKILAIDPSLTSTGWAVGNSEFDLLFGDLKNDLRGEIRITWIITKLKELLLQHKPNIIAFEDYSYGSHTSAYDLGELGGFIRVLLKEYKDANPTVTILKFAPSELKKFVTGKGDAQKDMIMMKLFQRFGVETANNNQADAVGLFFMPLLGKTPAEKIPKKKKK